MGQAIKQTVENTDDLSLAGLWRRNESLDEVLAAADVAIDFSLPDANADVLQAVERHRVPLVCGVSGLAEGQVAQMREVAKIVPIVFDRNMSQGIAVLNDVVKRVVASLGDDFDIEIHETHHVKKLDSPSGTALKLADAVAAAKGLDTAAADIKFEVERRGDVPGDHTIILSSSTERISLSHSVTTRQVFVEGAVRAARWVAEKPPGMYDMSDVLFEQA